MSENVRTAIWDGMVTNDGLARYYGKLAGSLSRREKWAAVATTAFGVVSAYSVANAWVFPSILFSTATVVASVVPLVFRYGGAISSAAYCQTRLSSLGTEWKGLWLEVDDLDPVEARRRWRRLQIRQNEITAFQSAKPIATRLSRSTQQETDDYWEKEKARLTSQTATATSLPPAGQGQPA